MRLPPWHDSASAAARRHLGTEDGEAAAREVARWERMRTYSARVCASLAGASVVEWGHTLDADGEHQRTPSGMARVSAQLVRLADGQVVSCPEARDLREDWAADPVHTLARLQGCGEAWPVAPTPQGWRAHPLTCSCSLCPLCVSMAAGERREVWTETLIDLARRGYTIVLMTRTRRARQGEGHPVVWTEQDDARWPRPAVPLARDTAPHPELGHVGAACPGESLGSAWDALSDGWRRVIDSRQLVTWRGAAIPRRSWWAQTVVAQLDAIEATQVRVEGDATVLRWHVHGHTILALAPGVIEVERDTVRRWVGDADARRGRWAAKLSDSCDWWSTWLDAWTGEVDAEERPQDAEVVGADGCCDVAKALREVVKYPGKLSEMTDAGIIEWLATVKGRRPLREGGTLHGGTRRGRVAHAVEVIEHIRADEGDPLQLADELRTVVLGGGWAAAVAGRLAEDDPQRAELHRLARALRGADRDELRAELREELCAAIREVPRDCGGGDYADVGVAWLRGRLTDDELREADDVGEAMAIAARAVEARRAARRPEGLVYTPPAPELGEEGVTYRLLDWCRLLTLARCGVRVGVGWRLHGPEGPQLQAQPIRGLIKAVSTYDLPAPDP